MLSQVYKRLYKKEFLLYQDHSKESNRNHEDEVKERGMKI